MSRCRESKRVIYICELQRTICVDLPLFDSERHESLLTLHGISTILVLVRVHQWMMRMTTR